MNTTDTIKLAATLGIAMAEADMRDDARRESAKQLLAAYEAADKTAKQEIKSAFNAAYAKRRKMPLPAPTDKAAMVTFSGTLRKAWSRMGELAKTGLTNPKRAPRPAAKAMKTGTAVPAAVVAANGETVGEPAPQGAIQPSPAYKAKETASRALTAALNVLKLSKLPLPMAKQVEVATMAFALFSNADGMAEADLEVAVNALNVKRSA
jgi:hypothetical protein